MIRIGRTIRWYNNYIDEVNFCKENGFDFMQIWFKDGQIVLDNIPEPKIEHIKKIGFPVIFHAVFTPVDIDLYGDTLLDMVEYLGDTEVIIHGYEEYGVDIVKKLRGMFAFVIWDKNKKQLFGARDYFGIKPFYYTNMNNTFMFGSEIKSFLKHPDFKKEINKKALKPYLTFQYSALEETFFKGVFIKAFLFTSINNSFNF